MIDREDIRAAGGDVLPEALQARLPESIEKAEEAFWAVIAEDFPEVKSGDVSPDWVWTRDKHNAGDVVSWIAGNLPVFHAYEPLRQQLRDVGFNPVEITDHGIRLLLDQSGIDERHYVLLTTPNSLADNGRRSEEQWRLEFYEGDGMYLALDLGFTDLSDPISDENVAQKVRTLFNLVWNEPAGVARCRGCGEPIDNGCGGDCQPQGREGFVVTVPDDIHATAVRSACISGIHKEFSEDARRRIGVSTISTQKEG